MFEDVLKGIVAENDTKIVLFVIDGLGGLARETDGPTELESASTPNLDKLASDGVCGLHEPIHKAITPGSGPAHLALFGYDPINYQVGRGVLSALGIDYDLGKDEVVARGNFCTLDENRVVTDRRAGRISTETNERLCEKLRGIELSEGSVDVRTVSEHRFLLVLKGEDLEGEIADTDPQKVGVAPLAAKPKTDAAKKTATLVDEFVEKAEAVLAEQDAASGVLLRGFSKRPDWPTVTDLFGLNPVAIASYPMYRGVAKLVGMKAPKPDGSRSAEIDLLSEYWDHHDFFYLHFKKTDSAGEDGDFEKKARLIEVADRMVPEIMELNPDVVIVTGDHSTPAVLKGHSWHPVPVVLWSRHCRTDPVKEFGERSCLNGGLGPCMSATDLIPLALANAGRLKKFGA